MNIDPTSVNELIRSRRSVFPKQFVAGKQVPDEIIKEILINATWAPNHGQTEPWYFKVFTGKGLQTFAELQAKLYTEALGEKAKKDKLQKMLEQPLMASHIISIGVKRDSVKPIPEIEDIEAVACAVQNIYLSVSAYGLGGYWTSGGITYLEEAKQHFGLDENDKLVGFFYIGYVAVPSPSAKRIPIEEKSDWVTE